MSIQVRTVNDETVKLETSHARPPIPNRKYDWSAVTSDYEPGHPIGNGASEDAAIADLIEQLEERA